MRNENTPLRQNTRMVDGNSTLSTKQLTVVCLSNQLAQQIAVDGRGEIILAMFRSSVQPGNRVTTDSDIAREVLLENSDSEIAITYAAVRRFIRDNIPTEERERIRKAQKTQLAIQRMENLGPEKRAAMFKKGGEGAAKLYKEGKTKLPTPENPWSKDERNMVIALADSPMFRYRRSPNNPEGYPNWLKIAELVENAFHRGRTIKALRHVYQTKNSTK